MKGKAIRLANTKPMAITPAALFGILRKIA